MRRLHAFVIPLALAALATLAGVSSADEIIDACDGHDIEAHVRPYACVGINYPVLPPSGG